MGARRRVVLGWMLNGLLVATGGWFIFEVGRRIGAVVEQLPVRERAEGVSLPAAGSIWPLRDVLARDRDRTVEGRSTYRWTKLAYGHARSWILRHPPWLIAPSPR